MQKETISVRTERFLDVTITKWNFQNFIWFNNNFIANCNSSKDIRFMKTGNTKYVFTVSYFSKKNNTEKTNA